MKTTIGLATLLLATSTAHAKFVTNEDTGVQEQPVQISVPSEQKVKGFYLGGGLGTTAFDSYDYNTLEGEGNGSTIKLIAGYQFNRVFALEGQYTAYGDIQFPGELEAYGYFWEPTAVSLTANLGYTFSNGLRPFGVVGVSVLDLGETLESNLDDAGASFRYGVGLEYAPAILKGLSARVGYEVDYFGIEFVEQGYYNASVIKEFTLGSFYASVTYKF